MTLHFTPPGRPGQVWNPRPTGQPRNNTDNDDVRVALCTCQLRPPTELQYTHTHLRGRHPLVRQHFLQPGSQSTPADCPTSELLLDLVSLHPSRSLAKPTTARGACSMLSEPLRPPALTRAVPWLGKTSISLLVRDVRGGINSTTRQERPREPKQPCPTLAEGDVARASDRHEA